MNLLYVLFVILATVCVFIFAIRKFSKQVEVLAGPHFKNTLRTMTSTPLWGALLGTVFTAIIQSSTATTVMLVGLVDAGAISFYNSLGVIFGANIGTTITSQLVAFNVIAIAPLFVLLGFVLEHTETQFRRYGKLIFYFGLVFLCFYFISELIEPLKNDATVIGFISTISNVYWAILFGAVITVLFQSSSMISGLSIILVAQGILSFDQAFGIILGANIGTTSTALFASTVMNISAKKAALAHFLFNVLGVLLFLPFIHLFGDYILGLGMSSELSVAAAHVIFNILSAIIALVFVGKFYKLINLIATRFEAQEA